MRCKIRTKDFITLLKIVHSFNRDMSLFFTKDLLYAEGVDSANACLLRIAIPAESDEEGVFCTDYEKLMSILTPLKDDFTEITIADMITFVTGNTKFKLSKYLQRESKELPKMEWPCSAELKLADFTSTVTTISQVSQILELGVHDGVLTFGGNDSVNIVESVVPTTSLTPEADIDVHLSIDYFKDTIMQFKGGDTIRLGLKTDAPMIAHVKTDNMEMQLILAPRVRDV